MNFTREPIIETIMSPKEGYKLLVRSSKSAGQEEYYVDALEIVSFGTSIFFRSLERPRCFLVPVGDYEVTEVKEVRAPLKNASVERSIKIGGGRDAPMRREPAPEKLQEVDTEETVVAEEDSTVSAPADQRGDRRRDRRRNRRRRGPHHPHDDRGYEEKGTEEAKEPSSEGGPAESGTSGEAHVSSPAVFSSLLPPPPMLISDTIGRYKEKLAQQPPESEPPRKPVEEEKKKEENTGGESKELHRVSSNENSTFTPNYSYPSQEDIHFFP